MTNRIEVEYRPGRMRLKFIMAIVPASPAKSGRSHESNFKAITRRTHRCVECCFAKRTATSSPFCREARTPTPAQESCPTMPVPGHGGPANQSHVFCIFAMRPTATPMGILLLQVDCRGIRSVPRRLVGAAVIDLIMTDRFNSA